METFFRIRKDQVLEVEAFQGFCASHDSTLSSLGFIPLDLLMFGKADEMSLSHHLCIPELIPVFTFKDVTCYLIRDIPGSEFGVYVERRISLKKQTFEYTQISISLWHCFHLILKRYPEIESKEISKELKIDAKKSEILTKKTQEIWKQRETSTKKNLKDFSSLGFFGFKESFGLRKSIIPPDANLLEIIELIIEKENLAPEQVLAKHEDAAIELQEISTDASIACGEGEPMSALLIGRNIRSVPNWQKSRKLEKLSNRLMMQAYLMSNIHKDFADILSRE